MTGPQIEKRENEIYLAVYGGKCRIKENEIRPMTDDENREMKELSCRRMINSCLCYGNDFYHRYNRWVYGKGYIVASYADEYMWELGEVTVNRLYEEQKGDFNKATLLRNVYTDSEGVSYNSIVWKDEE